MGQIKWGFACLGDMRISEFPLLMPHDGDQRAWHCMHCLAWCGLGSNSTLNSVLQDFASIDSWPATRLQVLSFIQISTVSTLGQTSIFAFPRHPILWKPGDCFWLVRSQTRCSGIPRSAENTRAVVTQSHIFYEYVSVLINKIVYT